MKLFIAFCFLLSVQLSIQFQTRTVSGVAYQIGGKNSRVVISSGHGGEKKLNSGIPQERPEHGCLVNGECVYNISFSCPGAPHNESCHVKKYADHYANELAESLTDKIASKLATKFKAGQTDDYRPHLIINEVHRSRVDVNRDISKGTFLMPEAIITWQQYHAFIAEAKQAAFASGQNALYIDIHAQIAESWNMVEMLLSKDGPQGLNQDHLSDSFAPSTSIEELFLVSGESLEDLVRGSISIGGQMERDGFEMVPSPVNKKPGDRQYYSGGASLKRYSMDMTGFQVDTSNEIRFNITKRENFADSLADAVITWLDLLDREVGTPSSTPPSSSLRSLPNAALYLFTQSLVILAIICWK